MLFSHFYQQEGRFPISQSHNIAQLFLFYSTLLNTIGHDLQKSLIVLALCIQVSPTGKPCPCAAGAGTEMLTVPPPSPLLPHPHTPCAHFHIPGIHTFIARGESLQREHIAGVLLIYHEAQLAANTYF